MRGLVWAFLCVWSFVANAGTVDVVQNGPVVSSGKDLSSFGLYIPGLTSDDRIKVRLDGGKVIGVQPVTGDLYEVIVRPPAVNAREMVNAFVQVSGATNLEAEVKVSIAPAATGSLVVSFEPERVTAATKEVLVRVSPKGPVHLPVESRQIIVSATDGAVGRPVSAGDGTWVALYAPPKDRVGTNTVLFTVTDLTAPEAVVGFATLDQLAPFAATFTGPSGGSSTLVVGEDTYGPQPISPVGDVAFELLVEPAGTTGTLTVTNSDGGGVTSEVAIPSASTNQLAFAPLPSPLKIPAGRSLRLLVAATDIVGAPVKKAEDITVTGPGNPLVSEVGGGWYAVDLTAPQDTGPWTVEVRRGDKTDQQAIEVVEAPPALVMASDPPSITEDTQDLKLSISAKDFRGAAFAGRGLTLVSPEGLKASTISDDGDGNYSAKLAVGDSKNIVVAAHPDFQTGSLPGARLVVWPGSTQVVAGQSSPVFVALLDAMGLPLSSIELRLQVAKGRGEIAPKVITGKSGVGVSFHTGAEQPGVDVIRAAWNDLSASTVVSTVVQAGAYSAPWALGSGQDKEDIGRWSGAVASAAVFGGSPILAALPPPTAAGPAPPIAAAAPAAPAVAPIATAAPAPVAAAPAPVSPAPVAKPQKSTGAVGTAPLFSWAARGGLSMMGFGFHQETEEASESIPSFADFNVGFPAGGIGVNGSGELWIRQRVAVDVRAQWTGYRIDVVGERQSDGLGRLVWGGRYRSEILPGIKVDGGAWLQRTDASTFAYAQQKATAVMNDLSLTGVRVGGRATAEIGPVGAWAELAETFGAAPVISEVGFGAEFGIPGVSFIGKPFVVHAEFLMNWRHFKREVDGVTVKIRDNQKVLNLGAGLAF